MIYFRTTTTPVRSAAPLPGQTVSSGGEGSGLSIDQVGEWTASFLSYFRKNIQQCSGLLPDSAQGSLQVVLRWPFGVPGINPCWLHSRQVSDSTICLSSPKLVHFNEPRQSQRVKREWFIFLRLLFSAFKCLLRISEKM